MSPKPIRDTIIYPDYCQKFDLHEDNESCKYCDIQLTNYSKVFKFNDYFDNLSFNGRNYIYANQIPADPITPEDMARRIRFLISGYQFY